MYSGTCGSSKHRIVTARRWRLSTSVVQMCHNYHIYMELRLELGFIWRNWHGLPSDPCNTTAATKEQPLILLLLDPRHQFSMVQCLVLAENVSWCLWAGNGSPQLLRSPSLPCQSDPIRPTSHANVTCHLCASTSYFWTVHKSNVTDLRSWHAFSLMYM